jgi:hypothetical protein
MNSNTIARASSIFLSLCVLVAALTACGGGGSSPPPAPPPPSITFSTSSVTFSAAAPYSATPVSQIITATVGGVTAGSLYFKVIENNPNIATVTNIVITGANTGQATVVPGSSPAASMIQLVTLDSSPVVLRQLPSNTMSGRPSMPTR